MLVCTRIKPEEWEGAGCVSNYRERQNVSFASFPRWGQPLKKKEWEIKEERGKEVILPDLCSHHSQDTGTAKKELWNQIYFKFLFSYFIFLFPVLQSGIHLLARTHLFPSLGLSCVKNGLLWQETRYGEITCDSWFWINSCCTLSFAMQWRKQGN